MPLWPVFVPSRLRSLRCPRTDPEMGKAKQHLVTRLVGGCECEDECECGHGVECEDECEYGDEGEDQCECECGHGVEGEDE